MLNETHTNSYTGPRLVEINSVGVCHNEINSASGANTMEFPIGKFAGGANTLVKTIDSRWRRKP